MILRAASRLFWIAFQTASTGVGLWAGLTAPTPGMPRPFFLIMETGLGFFFGLAITVAWVLVFQLFRYRLPALVRRGVEQVKGRHALRG